MIVFERKDNGDRLSWDGPGWYGAVQIIQPYSHIEEHKALRCEMYQKGLGTPVYYGQVPHSLRDCIIK